MFNIALKLLEKSFAKFLIKRLNKTDFHAVFTMYITVYFVE